MKAKVSFTGERWMPELCVFRREPQQIEVDIDRIVVEYLCRQGGARFPILDRMEITDDAPTGTPGLSSPTD